jgi:hypothetical protein
MRLPLVLAVALLVSAAHAQGHDPAVIDKAVRTCVDFVRTLPESSKEWPPAWFDNFDAYYNPATGRVVTIQSYDIAKFQFDKCMTGQGVPLHEQHPISFADVCPIKQTAPVLAEAVHFHCLTAALKRGSAAPGSLRCPSMANREGGIRDEAESATAASSGIA